MQIEWSTDNPELNRPRLRVFLLTANYPYEGEEDSFLPQELRILVEKIDLIVVPTRKPGRLAFAADHSVEFDLSLASRQDNCFWRAVALLEAITSPQTWHEVTQGVSRAKRTEFAIRAIASAVRARVVARWLKSRLAATGPLDRTLVYCWWSDSTAYGAVLASIRHKIPVVVRAHGYDLYPERHPFGRIPFQRRIVTDAALVLADSEAGRARLAELFPASSRHIQLGRLGVPLPGFAGHPSTDGTLRICTISSAVPVKRLQLLLDGLVALRQIAPEIPFLWTHIGGGPLLDDLRTRAELAECLRGRLEFLGRLPSHDLVLQFFNENACDLVVNVSESEGTPVALMEAISLGIPIMATAVGGNPEIVRASQGVLLPASPNASEVAQALADFARQRQGTRVDVSVFKTSGYWSDEAYEMFVGTLEGLSSHKLV